ncbi:HAMP domain-containing sensor histidine kinase [Pikeienuella sp. HZG-20]|uniref:sensor histidine kinase n=1 Tax=Paludibacillus litoralis TaxID=3133267 RepID=UPI0030EB83EB
MSEPPTAFRPEFLWNPRWLRLVWANDDGLAFWGEDSLDDLAERVFAPEDETVRTLAARIAEIEEGGDGAGGLLLRPRAEPVRPWARCAIETGADGRSLLRVALFCKDAREDRMLALARAGFDAAPQPLAICSETGVVLARNEADRRAFGAGPGALFDRYADPEEGRRALAAALGAGIHSRKTVTVGAEGVARHRVSLRRMSDPATGALAVIAEFHGVADRPAATGVSAAELAKIAHDLRSPLTAIDGFAEFIAASGDAMKPERRDSYLADIRAASRRILAMVEEMVALGSEMNAAGRAGRQVDLRALAEEVARLHRPAAIAAGVTLSVSGDATVAAPGDEISVHRIVGNLVMNALEHGGRPGGTVQLIARRADEGAALEVADDGAGMSEAALAVALRPFGRGAGVKEDSGRSGGLGLSNARELAAEMGARLDIRTAPGAGFAARLIFPKE